MKQIAALVRGRKSVRTFDSREIDSKDMECLLAFIAEIENPYGITVTFQLLNGKEHGLTSPVVSGTDLYVGAKIKKGPYAEEAFGYSFEQLVLYAQSLGIGTVWLGGTMDRGAFERAMVLADDEMMCCVSPLGYPASKPSLRESMMRKAIKADHRMPFEALFFDGTLDTPLTAEKSGLLADPLEMVRWAPSAVNRQPWRIVLTETAAHFYLKRTKGFVRGAAGDMQKIDLGIAMCHFALAMKEQALDFAFSINDPGIEVPADTEYIASFFFLQ